MSPIVWFAIGILVVVAASVIVVSVASKRAESQLSAVRQEMQNSLATQGQNVAAQISQQFSQQIGNLMQTVTQQLGQVRQELQNGVATSEPACHFGATGSGEAVALVHGRAAADEPENRRSPSDQPGSFESHANAANGAGRRENARHAGRNRAGTDSRRRAAAKRVRNSVPVRINRRGGGRDHPHWRTHALH